MTASQTLMMRTVTTFLKQASLKNHLLEGLKDLTMSLEEEPIKVCTEELIMTQDVK